MSLREILAALDLERTVNSTDFVCRQIPNSTMLLGRDGRNNIVLLSEKTEPNVNLHAGGFHYSSAIKVKWFDQVEHENEMSVLRTVNCGFSEEAAFLRVVESILLTSQGSKENETCRELVEAWFSLLVTGREVTRNSIIGLAGELLLIMNSHEPERAISRWQWRNADLLDFVWMDMALEVKTSTTGLRHHQTSLFQHSAAISKSTLLVSLLVDESIEGVNVLELQSRIQELLPKDSATRLDLAAAVIRRVGISDLVYETRLDLPAAIRSLKLVRWSDLPNPMFPSGVLSAEWAFVVPAEKAKSIGGQFVDDVLIRKMFIN